MRKSQMSKFKWLGLYLKRGCNFGFQFHFVLGIIGTDNKPISSVATAGPLEYKKQWLSHIRA